MALFFKLKNNYKAIFNAMDKSQAVIQFKPDGTILDANTNFLNAMGYRLDEIKGRHHSMFAEAGYADTDEYKEFWKNLARGKFQSAEYLRIGKGGKQVWIRATYNPIFNNRGKVVRVIKFATDTTEAVLQRMAGERAKLEMETSIKDSIGTVSSAIAETSSVITNVATGTEQLTQSVDEIAQSMSSSKMAVSSVVEQSTVAQKSVGNLEQAASAMNNVVVLIEDIADKINLLALNAAIEAARAGDAGRGFAVVADEVKKLASQTTDATGQITSEIKTMQQTTTEVVSALGLIGNSVNEVMDGITQVATATDEQSATAKSILESMNEVDKAVESINASITEVAKTAGAV